MAAKTSSRERFPELYAPISSQTDPHTRTRTVPMRVLCLGMPRTGTASLWTALKEMGYVDCYHMINAIQNPPDAEMWTDAFNAQLYGKGKPFGREEWDHLLGDCQAVCDMPAVAFSESLIAAYPDAKVILTLRDVDSWYNSMMNSVIPVSRSKLMQVLMYFDPVLLGRWIPMINILFFAFFDGKPFEDVGKQKFREQYELVRRVVPKERLLEYRVGEGWDKLCSFLEVPVPDHPFPHTNEQKTFGERIDVMIGLALKRVAMRVLPLLGALVAVGAAAWVYRARLG